MPDWRANRQAMQGIEEHKADCLARWQALEQKAMEKWRLYRRKRISRKQLKDWLSQQSEMDERTIRGIFNAMRGGK